MRFVYGDSYGDVANRELGMDSARDARYFNSLAANRAAQAQRLAQAQSEANNQLSWQQLLTQAALSSRHRDDDLAQQDFGNRLQLARFNEGVTGAEQNQSNVVADMALRKRGLDLQYGPDQRSDRALGRFEKLAPSLADDPAITEESISALRPDLSADDLSVAQAMFRANRRKLMEDEAERTNATEMANRQMLTEQREGYAGELLPTITRATIPRAASTSWFGDARAKDVEPYKAKVLANIMAGEFDEDGFQPMPPSDASEIFREVSRNRRMEPSPYNEQAGRFEFTPRFTTTPQSAAVIEAPRDPLQRQRGVIYQTPKGALRWTGTGWMAP